MCLFCTIACAFWEKMIGQHFRLYLPWDNLIPKDAVEGAVIISLLAFFSYAIILNTVVPISLYVRYFPGIIFIKLEYDYYEVK